MRALRWIALAAGMFGGLLGVSMTADAAPMPVSAGTIEQAAPAPTVQKAYYGRRFYGRRFYGPRFYRRPYYGRRFYGPRRFYGRPYYRRRFFY